MQTFASDPVVPRPLRPEPSSARVRNEQPGAFDAMLDTRPPETPRQPRVERTRRDDATPKERTQSRADRRAPEAEPSHTADSAKPADAPITRQAKNGQPSSDPAGAETAAKTETKAGTDGETAPTDPAVQIAAALNAIAAEADVTAPKSETAEGAIAAEPAAKDGDEVPTSDADVKPVEITAPVVVAVAVPAPTPRTTAIEPTANTEIAPVVATPAPIPPADLGAAEAAAVAPADNKDKAAKPVAPELADIDADASSDAPKPAAPKDVAAADAKPAEQKADKPKPGQPTAESPAATRQADTSAPAAGNPTGIAQAPADPQARPAHQTHTQSAEPAAPRVASSEARPDTALSQASLPGASLPANAPIMPFGLALSSSLAATLPHTALRVDAAADNAVPLAGVAVEIASRAQEGLKRFDIRLDPPELGRIDVRLDVDQGGKVTSRLIVERTETLDLLRRDAPQLERALQQAGLNTEGGMQFSLRDQSFANRDQSARDGTNASHLVVPEDDTAAADAARRGYGRLIGLGGGIDIRV